MRKELFAAAMILGIIVLAACTKMNPIEEIIENQNSTETSVTGGGHGGFCPFDSLGHHDSIIHHCDTMICDTTGHHHGGHGHGHGHGGQGGNGGNCGCCLEGCNCGEECTCGPNCSCPECGGGNNNGGNGGNGGHGHGHGGHGHGGC